jgi:hypothetical protein
MQSVNISLVTNDILKHYKLEMSHCIEYGITPSKTRYTVHQQECHFTSVQTYRSPSDR